MVLFTLPVPVVSAAIKSAFNCASPETRIFQLTGPERIVS